MYNVVAATRVCIFITHVCTTTEFDLHVRPAVQVSE
jgi:hypothetical protein